MIRVYKVELSNSCFVEAENENDAINKAYELFDRALKENNEDLSAIFPPYITETPMRSQYEEVLSIKAKTRC